MKFITDSPFCALVETLGDPVLAALFSFPLLSAHDEPAEVSSLASNHSSRPDISSGFKISGKILPVPMLVIFPDSVAVEPVAFVNFPLAATGLLVVPVVKFLLVGAHTPPGAPSLNALTR